MHNKHPNFEITLESIKFERNVIQLSAASVSKAALEELMIHRNAKNLVASLGEMFNKVSDFLSSRVAGFSNRDFTISSSRVNEIVENRKYNTIQFTKVPVPVGLSVDWITFIEVLSELSKTADSLYDRSLYPFSQFVGSILNNPEKLQQASFRPNISLTDITALQTKLGRCLKAGSRDKIEYGKVFRRNQDLVIVRDTLTEMVEQHKIINPSMIAESVKKLDGNLELLMDKIKDPNEPYRMTPQKVKELADICYVLANEVEVYSIYTVLLEQAVVAINKTIDLVEKQ